MSFDNPQLTWGADDGVHATREAIYGEFGNGPATVATIAAEMKIPIASVHYHVLVLVQGGRLLARGEAGQPGRTFERNRGC